MAEVHITLKNPDVVFHNPATTSTPAVPSAGQPVTQMKDASGKVTKSSGTTAGVTHSNPA